MARIKEAPQKDGRERYLDVKEVAEICHVSASTVRQEIRRGNLKAKKFGRNVRVHEQELARYEEKSEPPQWRSWFPYRSRRISKPGIAH